MKLEPANIVCPACGSGNYMRHLIGKNVGYLNMKCINCNSYFNFDELYKRRIGEVLKPKPITNYDLLIRKTPEELTEFLEMIPHCGNPATYTTDGFCVDDGLRTKRQWLSWLKQEVNDGRN